MTHEVPIWVSCVWIQALEKPTSTANHRYPRFCDCSLSSWRRTRATITVRLKSCAVFRLRDSKTRTLRKHPRGIGCLLRTAPSQGVGFVSMQLIDIRYLRCVLLHVEFVYIHRAGTVCASPALHIARPGSYSAAYTALAQRVRPVSPGKIRESVATRPVQLELLHRSVRQAGWQTA